MSKFSLIPLQSNLFIKPDKPDEVSAGGIIVPVSVQERPNRGTVVAMGEELQDKKVKVGDKVFHVKSAGLPFEEGGETYILLRYTDCLCIDN